MLENRKLNITLLVVGVALIFVPYLGYEVLKQLSGLLLIFIFFFIFFKEFKNDEYEIVDKKISIAWFAIAVLCLIGGVSIIFSLFLVDFLGAYWLHFVGILLIANSGLLFYLNNLDHQEATFKLISGPLGVFYIFMGLGIINSMYLGIILGIFLASYGYLMISE